MKSKKSKTIGVDLDDVLLSFHHTISLWHNNHYKTSYTANDIVSYKDSLKNLWNCSVEEMVEKVFDFYRSEEHFNAQPVEGSVEGVKILKKAGRLYIITARPEMFRKESLRWLNRYFPDVFKGVYFTNAFFGNGKKRTKAELCSELGIDIFIDDSLENAKDIASHGIPVLLLNTSWNQGNIDAPIVRVSSWKEIANNINKYV